MSWREINAAINDDNDDAVIELCQKFLKTSPSKSDHEECERCLLIAYLHTNKLSEVIDHYHNRYDRYNVSDEDFQKKFQPADALYYTYALYRSKQHEKSVHFIELFQKNNNNNNNNNNKSDASINEALTHLQAQSYYRMGHYSKAADLYASFPRNSSPEDDEFATNIIAAFTLAGRTGEALDIIHSYHENKQLEKSYEFLFNGSCAALEAHELLLAKQLIEQSVEICKTNLMDGESTEEEKERELGTLYGQEAIIYQLLNDSDRAYEIYSRILKNKPTDANVIAVSSNNIITLKKNVNEKLFDSIKKSDRAFHQFANKQNKSGGDASEIEEKLSLPQRRIIQLNRIILHLLGKHYEKCKIELNEYNKLYHEEKSETIILIQAALYVREKKEDMAIDLLKKFIADNNGSLQGSLALAHIQLTKNNLDGAIQILNDINNNHSLYPTIAHSPALISVLISLYDRQGQQGKSSELFQSSINYWKIKEGYHQYITIVSAYANWLELSSQYELAIDQYNQLINFVQQNASAEWGQQLIINGKPIIWKCKRVLIARSLSHELVLKYSSDLPPLPSLSSIQKLNVIDSEKESDSARKKKSIKSGKADTEDDMNIEHKSDEKKKKNKKKRRRIPKGADPSKIPTLDPERWLPRHERSNYKKKKTKGGKMLPGGSQGSTSASAAAAITQSASTASTASSTPSSASSGMSAMDRASAAKKKQRKQKK